MMQSVLRSVRAKIMLFAALALMIASAAFTLLALHQLDARQLAQHAAQQKRAGELLDRLFQQQFTRMQSLGTLIADLPGARVALAEGNALALAYRFDPFWSDLNLNHGLDRIVFFTSDARQLGEWGMAESDSPAPALASAAMATESAGHWLQCAGRCLFATAVPLVQAGSGVGALVLATGLQDLVSEFRQLAGAELAVMAHNPADPPAAQDALRHVVYSVSGGVQYERLARGVGPAALRAQGTQLEHEGRTYRLDVLDAPVAGAESVKFLVMRDVTSERAEASAAVRSSVLLGALILLLALAMLYLLLRPTMNRLRQAMNALPLLGEGRYAQAREACRRRARNRRYTDEVDALGDLTCALAYTLESLQEETRAHTATLSAQATQLEHERDFISGLLDTAPVLILTHAGDGRVRLANAHAVRVSGRAATELIGQDFGALFVGEAWRESSAELGERLRQGEIVHDEGTCPRPDGSQRDLLWFHSLLAEADKGYTTLSVGLDVTDFHRVERNLILLSEHDGVTGLYNRRAFKRELDGLLTRGERGVMLVCDIDEFKTVNESGGHEAGDRVLLDCARQIESLQPRPLLAARLGGDDFAMVFPGLSEAEAIVLTRALNQSMARLGSGDEQAGLRGRLSVCVGVVSFPDHGRHADALLAKAEIALSQARAKGHGSWHLYAADDPHHEVAGRRAYWRAAVERGLEEGLFVLHFQPIMHIASGEIRHYEALLRLQGADGKLIPPGLFIDVAESTGLIRRIDRWVIDSVVDFTARQNPCVKIALNLSSRSFDDDVAFETMRDALARHELPGERLLLEITETAALANFTSALRIMARFRGLGCAFGLDDFGVGYSSFQYLKELPVDFVKIDGSFIKGLTFDPDDVVFVRALNDAVKGFGKATVAEFVEDEATLEILRQIGVDYAQGYLIGRPGEKL